MIRHWLNTSAGRVGAVVFLALALLMRVAVGDGLMPVNTGHGIEIAFCTGTGPAHSIIELDQHQPADPGHDHAPCAFAMAHVPGLAALVPNPLLSALLEPQAQRSKSLPDLVSYWLASPPPPSQAPPFLG
ncbi:MAG: hypothetical protein KGQ42_08945 [Alphaproteobacteria bacterium]|nr:hypothetical protein [Alphaproteobacteria bacterium]MDE2341307.1 hypothetical protein [Alphaproteobacteria bacterium]